MSQASDIMEAKISDRTYEYFKSLEGQAQALLFSLPHEGSQYQEALKGIKTWEISAAVHFIGKLRDAAKDAATTEYMRDKD